MFVNDSFKTAMLPIANLATGGNIGTAAVTVDIASAFELTQTTAGQVVTLPAPTDTVAGDRVILKSAAASTASFTVYGVNVDAGEWVEIFWNGTVWTTAVDDGRNQGARVLVASVPAGNFNVTHNFAMPATKFSWINTEARNAAGQVVQFRRVPASDTANTIAFNSTVALSNITFDLTPNA
jgi:hypothetical protein